MEVYFAEVMLSPRQKTTTDDDNDDDDDVVVVVVVSQCRFCGLVQIKWVLMCVCGGGGGRGV